MLIATPEGFVLINQNGKMASLAEATGQVFFESSDCSGPPVAVGHAPNMSGWYQFARVWPSSGAERKPYRTTTSFSWIGRSTMFNAVDVVEAPDAPLIGDVPGPLSIMPAA